MARCWLLLSPTRAECDFESELDGNVLKPTLLNCRTALLDWFNTMKALPRKVAEARRAFFFSGHGMEIEPERQILLPSDYLEPTSGTPYMALSTSNLVLGVKTLNVRDFYFLLDACRNDDEELRLIQDLNGESILTVYPPYKFARPPCNTPIFYASASGSQAWEPPDPSYGLSVFGQAILDGLRARPGSLVPDCSGEGSCAVRVHLLDGHLKKRVAEIASKGHATQYAVLGGMPIDTNAVVTLVPRSKSIVVGAPVGPPLGLGHVGMNVPPTWDRFVLNNWRPTAQDQNRGDPMAHQVFGSEEMTAVWVQTLRFRRLDTGRVVRKNQGYVIHQVAHHRTETYRVEFSLTAMRGSYWMEFSDPISRFALLLPDDLAEAEGHDALVRPRFLLEMDFDHEADPGKPCTIRRLDLGLSLTGQNVWLQRAATVAWLYYRAALPEALGHPDMSALLAMLVAGIQSPLAAVVAAIVLLKAGRTDEMKGWIAELAARFPYLPDGPVLFAEWRLQVNEEERLPADALHATLRLMDRGLPFTNDALSYARRQVDAYMLQEDLDRTTRDRLEALRRQLGDFFCFSRSGGLFGTLVGPEESNASNSEPMFLNPLPHLLTRPCPFEWMGVQPIVLRPGLPHVIDKLGSTVPRSSLQVVVTECADQQLRFVEPRGVDRGEATSPPAGASRQVVPRLCGRMGRVVIVDQIDSAQVTMPMSECPQLLDVVLGAFRVEARRLHLSAVNDQEEQDVDRAVPRVIELTLRDRAGDRMPDGMSFQDLEVGFLIGTDHPEAPPGQPLGVGVAPEDLLGTLLEVSVDARRPPIPRAMRLEVHLIEDRLDRPIADGRDDPIFDRLAGQILARPVGDVQALGDWLQAGQLNDLCTLQGGNPGRSPGPLGWFQEIGQARVLIATADPPDSRRIALGADGQCSDRLPRGDGQEDLSPLDLISGE